MTCAETVSILQRWVRGRCASPKGDAMLESTTARAAARYLTNDEAAEFLRLSPRTLEKQRVIGGGPRFRKFGRRVVYAVDDLETWANARSFEMASDPDYAVIRSRWTLSFTSVQARCTGDVARNTGDIPCAPRPHGRTRCPGSHGLSVLLLGQIQT